MLCDDRWSIHVTSDGQRITLLGLYITVEISYDTQEIETQLVDAKKVGNRELVDRVPCSILELALVVLGKTTELSRSTVGGPR
jgi:hypothetical protein